MSPSLPEDVFHKTRLQLSSGSVKADALPHGVRVVLANSTQHEQLERWIRKGYVLELRILKRTPDVLRQAILRIAHHTQEQSLIPWLPRLLEKKDLPTASEREERRTEGGTTFYDDVQLILRYHAIGMHIASEAPPGDSDQEAHEAWLQDVNALLTSRAHKELLYRIGQDMEAREPSPKVLTKALLIIGPLAHVFERWQRGSGGVFAVLAQALWREGKECYALHGAGVTPRQLFKKARIFILTALMAGVLSCMSQQFIEQGRISLGGGMFGLAAMLLPLQATLQDLIHKRRVLGMLEAAGKLRVHERKLATMALKDHLLRPKHVGAYLGTLVAPALGTLLFATFSGAPHNGWILAFIGATYAWCTNLLTFCQDNLRAESLGDRWRRSRTKQPVLDEAQEMR